MKSSSQTTTGLSRRSTARCFSRSRSRRPKLDGTPALKVTMGIPQMPNMPPESVKMLERMYGPGGKITAWIVPCDDRTVVFSYMGQEPLRRAIAAIKQGKPDLAADAEMAKVAALLPSGATWSVYCSPKGILDFVNQTMAAALPPGSAVKIPEDPDSARRLRSRWP